MEKFWMVFVVGNNQPTKQWKSIDEAKQEAERLARKTRETVVILESVQFCEIPIAVEWKSF